MRGLSLGLLIGALCGAGAMAAFGDRFIHPPDPEQPASEGQRPPPVEVTDLDQAYVWRGDEPLLPEQPLECDLRKVAVVELARLGDPAALPVLEAQRKRRRAHNKCMGDAIDQAIDTLKKTALLAAEPSP